MRHMPLNTAATANHVKFCESIHSSSGTLQLSVSKMTVHLRRPSLSVSTPESTAQTICETIVIDVI